MNKHSGEVFSWRPGFLTTTDLLFSYLVRSIDESDAFLKINLDDDHASVIIIQKNQLIALMMILALRMTMKLI